MHGAGVIADGLLIVVPRIRQDTELQVRFAVLRVDRDRVLQQRLRMLHGDGVGCVLLTFEKRHGIQVIGYRVGRSLLDESQEMRLDARQRVRSGDLHSPHEKIRLGSCGVEVRGDAEALRRLVVTRTCEESCTQGGVHADRLGECRDPFAEDLFRLPDRSMQKQFGTPGEVVSFRRVEGGGTLKGKNGGESVAGRFETLSGETVAICRAVIARSG